MQVPQQLQQALPVLAQQQQQLPACVYGNNTIASPALSPQGQSVNALQLALQGQPMNALHLAPQGQPASALQLSSQGQPVNVVQLSPQGQPAVNALQLAPTTPANASASFSHMFNGAPGLEGLPGANGSSL